MAATTFADLKEALGALHSALDAEVHARMQALEAGRAFVGAHDRYYATSEGPSPTEAALLVQVLRQTADRLERVHEETQAKAQVREKEKAREDREKEKTKDKEEEREVHPEAPPLPRGHGRGRKE